MVGREASCLERSDKQFKEIFVNILLTKIVSQRKFIFMGRNTQSDDPAMILVRKLWEVKRTHGWTMQQLGERMGYPTASARKSVSQFLKSHDPHIGMLRRFAKGLDIPVIDLFADIDTPKRSRR